jgi:hypothetical protein
MCPIYIAVRTQKRRQIYIPKLPSDILLKLLLYNTKHGYTQLCEYIRIRSYSIFIALEVTNCDLQSWVSSLEI